MHTEHLQNVRLVWVVSGWLVAVAITSLVVLVLASLGGLGPGAALEAVWLTVAVAIGFWAGGFSIGFRAVDAPILHGVAMGLASLVAWFLLNLLAGVAFRAAEWQSLSPALTAGLLVVQMAAAVGGTWFGHNVALGRAGSLGD